MFVLLDLFGRAKICILWDMENLGELDEKFVYVNIVSVLAAQNYTDPEEFNSYTDPS